MSLTLHKIAIKNPDTTDQVLLTNILEGVDGATAMGWSEEQENVQIEDNQRVEHSTVGTLEIKVLKGTSSEITLLDGFAGKKCEVSGWTIEGFLLFSDNVHITRVPDFNSNILNDMIRCTIRAPKGFYGSGSRVRSFYGGRNAIMLHDIYSYSGSTGSELLSGFTKVGSPTTNVSGQKQTVDGGISEGVKSALLYFPFVGTQLIASVLVSTTPAAYEFGIKFLQADGSTVVDTLTKSFTTGGTTRKDYTVTIPSNAAYMQFIILLEEIGSVEFELPAIKTLNKSFSE